MILRKAKINESEKILNFYQNVIFSLKDSEFNPKWNEKYPNLEYICSSIKKEELYVYTDEHEIISSFILNNQFDNDYNTVQWQISPKPSEITIIHTFAINSNYRQRGNSKKIFKKIKEMAMNNNQKTLRIDIVDGNDGAQKVFEKLGFKYIESIEIEHYAVGLQKFHLYEYLLK